MNGHNPFGDSAIVRIPVVSASGEALAPCKTAKMLSLLEQGKAVVRWRSDGAVYLQLRFDPESPVKIPESAGRTVKVRGDMDVWRLIPPKKEHIERLVSIARARCRGSVRDEDLRYLEAVAMAELDDVRSVEVLGRLAPIVKGILKSLSEEEADGDEAVQSSIGEIENSCVEEDLMVYGLLKPDCETLMKLFKSAEEAYRRLKPTLRRRLKLNKAENTLLKALKETLLKGSLKRIRSPLLLRLLAPIVEKLLAIVGAKISLPPIYRWEELGVKLDVVSGVIRLKLASAYNIMRKVAEKISRIAQSLGNMSARLWPEDKGFIEYLIMNVLHGENYAYMAELI